MMMHSEQRKQAMAEVEAELVEAIKQGTHGDELYRLCEDSAPSMFLTEHNREINTAVYNAWHKYREEVANFAGWCEGSCHGDASPEAFKAWRDVMENDFMFGRMHERYLEKVAHDRANPGVPPWRK